MWTCAVVGKYNHPAGHRWRLRRPDAWVMVSGGQRGLPVAPAAAATGTDSSARGAAALWNVRCRLRWYSLALGWARIRSARNAGTHRLLGSRARDSPVYAWPISKMLRQRGWGGHMGSGHGPDGGSSERTELDDWASSFQNDATLKAMWDIF